MNAILEWLTTDEPVPHWLPIAYGVVVLLLVVLWRRAARRAAERQEWQELCDQWQDAFDVLEQQRRQESSTPQKPFRGDPAPSWMEEHRREFFQKAELSGNIRHCLQEMGGQTFAGQPDALGRSPCWDTVDLAHKLADALIERHAKASKSPETPKLPKQFANVELYDSWIAEGGAVIVPCPQCRKGVVVSIPWATSQDHIQCGGCGYKFENETREASK